MSIALLIGSNFNKKMIGTYIEKFFFTDKGYFNWIAITSIIAIGTFIWTIWFNNKKYKADLVSKGRIDWMNQVRPLYAQYLAAVPKYMYLYNKAMVDGDKLAKESLDDKMDEIKRLYYELNLYIPNNDSNKSILVDIKLLWGELSYIGDYYDYGIRRNYFAAKINRYNGTSYDTEVDKYISKLINKASMDGNEYFKNEWEKIKKRAMKN